ncbi:MAG: hypothetical protein AUJ47_07200 [Candidatus Marinimicrobia bacterium CG1_02_48_14]|nr:MAG: hypothetical protein AUJ47_07200 [Candidatus Marinimicrobia bacterium CG1_02_48_14]PJA54354.1 MAG: CoA-disulfide reductase [Candidatus Marinimicrobia bacterium CG_4_9_14_3_um_filter_48_9]
MSTKYIIIGGDAAGMSAASRIKRNDPSADVIVYERDAYISYAACGIPYWLGGVVNSDEELQMMTPEIAKEKRGIDVFVNHEVVAIEAAQRHVTVHDLKKGELDDVSFDHLIIATGASAIRPNIPGALATGVFTLRTLADGKSIFKFLEENDPKKAVIVGAGYVGLEMAEAFRNKGIEVHLVELAPHIMPNFSAEMVEEVTEHLKANGVKLYLESKVKAIKEQKTGLKLEMEGPTASLNADIIILATGVKPNSDLAKEAGLKMGKSGAIWVNNRLKTNVDRIWAAGDCVELEHRVLGESVWLPLAPSANKTGRIAGDNASGGHTIFPGIVGTNVVKVFDYTLAMTGLTEKQALDSEKFTHATSVVITENDRAKYYPGGEPVKIKLVFDKRDKKIIGAQIVGKGEVAKRIDVIATAISGGMTADDLAMLDLSYAPPFAPVYDPVNVVGGVAGKR